MKIDLKFEKIRENEEKEIARQKEKIEKEEKISEKEIGKERKRGELEKIKKSKTNLAIIGLIEAEEEEKLTEEEKFEHIEDNWEENKSILLKTMFGKVKAKLLVDTGASPSLVSTNFVKKLGLMSKIKRTSLRTKTVDNGEMKIRGQITLNFSIVDEEERKQD